MTLNTRQHTLPIRTVLLGRVVLVIERHFAILVGLAVFRKRDFLRLCLALFFLRNQAERDKRQQQND